MNILPSQVDASGARILQDPPGNDVDSGQFPPFPTRIIEEPAGNIYGTWKQFSRRKFPVPDTAKIPSVSETGKTTETIVHSDFIWISFGFHLDFTHSTPRRHYIIIMIQPKQNKIIYTHSIPE